MVDINIQGDPKTQQRHRHSKRGHKIITYDPSADDKKAFAVLVKEQFQGKPLIGEIAVSIVFHVKRPKNHYRLGKFSHKLKEGVPNRVTNKPDIDNMIKYVLDACNEILWQDDKMVCEIQARKMYTKNPSTEIEAWVI